MSCPKGSSTEERHLENNMKKAIEWTLNKNVKGSFWNTPKHQQQWSGKSKNLKKAGLVSTHKHTPVSNQEAA